MSIRLSDCLLFSLHCVAPWDRWKSLGIGSAKIQKLTYKLTETKVHKVVYCQIVCTVLCFGCSFQAMLRQQSTFSGLWNVWIKRLARRLEIGQDTAPEPGALRSMMEDKMKRMEDDGRWWKYVLFCSSWHKSDQSGYLTSDRVGKWIGHATPKDKQIKKELSYRNGFAYLKYHDISTRPRWWSRLTFIKLQFQSFRQEFCLGSVWLKIAWGTLRRTDRATCATYATHICFSLPWFTRALLRNEHRKTEA